MDLKLITRKRVMMLLTMGIIFFSFSCSKSKKSSSFLTSQNTDSIISARITLTPNALTVLQVQIPAMETLRNEILSSGIQVASSLEVKLDAAIASANRAVSDLQGGGSQPAAQAINTTIDQLQATKAEVSAQSGNQIPASLSETWIATTDSIISSLQQVVVAAIPQGQLPTFLVLGSNRSGNMDILLYNLRAKKFVTPAGLNSSATEFDGELSFDRTFLSFTSDRPGGAGGRDIYIFDLVASQLVTLPVGINTTTSDLRPRLGGANNQFLVFDSFGLARPPQFSPGSAGRLDIFLFDFQTNSFVDLPGINTDDHELDAFLTADGTQIFFGRFFAVKSFFYNVLTKTIEELPGLNPPHGALDITPDASLIVFNAILPGGAGSFDIYLYDRTTQSLVDLPGINSPFIDREPTISPDGRFIAFTSNRATGLPGADAFDVFLYDRQTASFVDLTGVNSSVFDIAFDLK